MFSRPLANNNEQGGIIAYADDNNYVKLAWEMSSVTQAINKLRVVVIREQNGTATTLQVTGADAQRIVGADGAIWLRLAKRGSTYKAYYSSDGRVFKYMGTTTLNVRARAGRPVRVQPRRDRRPTSTSPSTTSGSRARVSRCRACRRPSRARSAAVVPATLSLALGAPASFGAFTPGVERTYEASTTATVTSSAGDAALSVSDARPASPTARSRSPRPLQVSFSKSTWPGRSPTTRVAIGFQQRSARRTRCAPAATAGR